jgi:hypothetical protein
MQSLMPDGSVTYWPEWASTVPQSDWTEEQSKWMAAHQERVLEMQRRLGQIPPALTHQKSAHEA